MTNRVIKKTAIKHYTTKFLKRFLQNKEQLIFKMRLESRFSCPVAQMTGQSHRLTLLGPMRSMMYTVIIC